MASSSQEPRRNEVPDERADSNSQESAVDAWSSTAIHQPTHRPPHHAVGFWHPRMRKVRTHVIVLWLRTMLILTVFILSILSLYWAVLYRLEENLRALTVQVVDFDGLVEPYTGGSPKIGPQVVQLTEQMLSMSGPSLGYQTVLASQFAYDPLKVRASVYEWDSWAAIVINPNATALLQQAVETGNASYDPTGAVQIIYQTARDSTTVSSYLSPMLQQFISQFTAQFGPSWGAMVMSNSSLTRDNLASAAAAVNPGISPLMYDLRPFQPAVVTPAKFVEPQGHPPLHFWQFIIWRWIATVVCYIFISLIYSLISLAFQISLTPGPASHVFSPPLSGATAYGHGSFAVYWMLNFSGMCALGIACENVAMMIGQPWTALWLIFWVITNVSTSFYSMDLAPGFYHWGRAWPLHQVVEASRHILFDLHSRIGINFGILFAWAAVNTALFPCCCYFRRWSTGRAKRKAEMEKDRYVVHDGEEKKETAKATGVKPPIRKRGFMREV
ncbi:MNNG and nitrosoguanidine resistance protein [Verticillium dahliae VdLs.17]|uniref:MNNG and nitrosoguanidine resistance protein n=2 Tax=Verticillium dahliae TaxID=27337 RepID=G2WXG4_VERDV|nr:MNNG and nitrosoguanidine resistance protein [Verticillium dahliae VdLs.17]EGY21419.1 MNNG and nitrosoguanidine resistance protein [Verticillium dahliae VdLs.17]